MNNKLKALNILLVLVTLVATAPRRARKRNRPAALKQQELKKESIFMEIIPEDQYEEHMDNFHLDIMHTLAVNPKDQMEYNFNFDVNEKANKPFVWVSYVAKGETRIEFAIMDRENNSVIYSLKDKKQLLAKLYFSNSQKVKFIFRNTAFNTYARITAGFECHNCKAASSYAVQEDVQESLSSIKEINYIKTRMQFISDVYTEKQEGYLKNLKRAHSKLFFFSVIEMLAVVAINVVQIYIIKNLVSRKRVI